MKNYLLYAVGEVILVVAGILLAIQIDGCYEEGKNRKLEKVILTNLYEEQNLNLVQLETKIIGCRQRIEFDSIILHQMSLSNPTLNSLLMVEMLSAISSPITFDPADGTMKELINSGKIGLISNNSLRESISAWESNLAEVKESEEYHLKLTLIPLQNYLSENVPLRIAFESVIAPGTHKLKKSTMNDLYFENILINSLLNLKFMERRYLMIQDEMKQMIGIIEEEIEQ